MTNRDTRRDRSIEREIEEERRLRRARITAAQGQVPEALGPDTEAATQAATQAATGTGTDEDDEDTAAKRMEQKALWVDLQIRKAMERGEFDNLPGAGKPIKGLGATHDPDWWVKNLVERERITGVLPPALALRKEDAELDALLDRETTEEGVRRVVVDFNRRVVEARRQLTGGPPVVTPTRDPDTEVASWRARLVERREQQRRMVEAAAREVPARRRWWHRRH